MYDIDGDAVCRVGEILTEPREIVIAAAVNVYIVHLSSSL